MALDPRRESNHLHLRDRVTGNRSRSEQPADHGRRGRAQPGGERDRVLDLDRVPGWTPTDEIEELVHRSDHEIAFVQGKDLGALAFHQDLDRVAPRLDLDLEVHLDRYSERVEAGTEVRDRGWHSNLYRSRHLRTFPHPDVRAQDYTAR